MKHTEEEIKSIKTDHFLMWELVIMQVNKAFTSLKTNDKQLAREVIVREKSVNAQELYLDQKYENFIALFAPVAIDLRFVISLLKITNNLERIGDFAESIALYVLRKQSKEVEIELFEKLNLNVMMDEALNMLNYSREALDKEDTLLAAKVLDLDDVIDEINRKSVHILAAYSKEHPEKTVDMFHLNSVIRRIERIGDRCSNIAEDVFFYIDAKELRHQEKINRDLS